ncbi:hypothetical protein [Aliiroseovarius sp. F20344]|uniref:hypothetical protein n=1 Tax=Aliiroseovarius sp. F20344 TaxID=2926414 RepID=UPI001FF15B49|nr:hypothetical protein [Aliiroseovarius sp. F20344]MCK0143540.1 hypothetical protein [Aliiroseovarius sp. F20344]
MISNIRRMWAAAPVATVVLALALSAGVFFGARSITSWIYWNDPAHIDQPIAGWMTPRYVAYSWQVPRDVMLEALALGDNDPKGRNLKRLAEIKGMSVEYLIKEIELAIANHRTNSPDRDQSQ